MDGCILKESPSPLCPSNLFKDDEYYICIYAERAGNVLLFHHEGGVDIGDVDAKATKLSLDIEETLNTDRVLADLISQVPKERQRSVLVFVPVSAFSGERFYSGDSQGERSGTGRKKKEERRRRRRALYHVLVLFVGYATHFVRFVFPFLSLSCCTVGMLSSPLLSVILQSIADPTTWCCAPLGSILSLLSQ